MFYTQTTQPAFIKTPSCGHVYLVGAGPGDPELLTRKAYRLIRTADVIYYDALISGDILDLIPEQCTKVYVGKRKDHHTLSQEKITQAMIRSAEQGLHVARLKGGDPFIFGRGGEEAEAILEAGIGVSIVPGISSALGCAASTGIPLTHRNHAQSVTFLTGHAAHQEDEYDWSIFASKNQTLVIFMGIGTVECTSRRLIAAGRDKKTPVAVIENGTTDREVLEISTLLDVPQTIARRQIRGPALLIVGDVVTQAHALKKILETAA